MFFRQRPAANATLSHLFGCAGKRMAIAVDVVAGDEDWFVEEAQRAGAQIVHVIDTHVGKPASTIGFEKRFNPMLSMSKDAFVEALTAQTPPQPEDMARIIAADLKGAAAALEPT